MLRWFHFCRRFATKGAETHERNTEVARELGCALETVTGLAQLGLLRAEETPERVRIVDQAIAQLKRRFVFLSVVAKRLGRRPRWLGHDCKRFGIKTIQVQKRNGERQLILRLRDAEALVQCIQRTPNSEYESCPKSSQVRLDPETRPTYSKKFKMTAIARVKAGESVASVSRSLNLKRQDLYRWMKSLNKLGHERDVFRAGLLASEANGSNGPQWRWPALFGG